MAAPETVPVTITPEAAAVVAWLGMQTELQRMLEHTLQTVPALKRIEVVLEPPYDTGMEDHILIEATRGDPFRLDDPTREQWGAWRDETFPPDVGFHIGLYLTHETYHAG
jgi:hypothetical protein